jgi:hypothetical protein
MVGISCAKRSRLVEYWGEGRQSGALVAGEAKSFGRNACVGMLSHHRTANWSVISEWLMTSSTRMLGSNALAIQGQSLQRWRHWTG